jgi:rRNA maturation endonuclease Nob1
MPTYIDSNFGAYEIQDEDDIAFYHDVQRRSVMKKCQRCKRRVKLLPDYAYCDSCTTIIERGGDY